MPENKIARFPEGPEGAKLFEAWIKKQPQEVQDDWAANTDKYKDKFKESSDLSVADRLAAVANGLRSYSK